MDFNTLITTFTANVPTASSFLAQTIVSAFISAMFSKKIEEKTVVYEAKVKYVDQIIDELRRDNLITATEYLKCKNLSDIAELADKARAKQEKANPGASKDTAQSQYDFAWFWRFFERAGYASNEEMKKLWAAVLNGEICHSGQFSYKAIETLFHMRPIEARCFQNMAQFAFVTPFQECLLPSSEEMYDEYDVTAPCVVNGHSDIYSILAAAYGITNEKVMYLEEYGLLSPSLTESSFSVTHDPIYIANDDYVMQIKLKETCDLESLEFDVCGHRFTSVARQLFAILEDRPSLSCLLDYARLIELRYSEMDVQVFRIIEINDENGMIIDDSVDYLRNPECESMTRLGDIGDIDIV